MSVMSLLPGCLDTQLQRDSGLTLYGYSVLSRLSMSPDRAVRMTDLAAESDGSPSRLSNVVAAFERKGWIERQPDPRDRRGTVAVLTDAGMRVVEQAAPGHVRAVQELVIDPLTPRQLATLVSIGDRIRAGLDLAPIGERLDRPPSC